MKKHLLIAAIAATLLGAIGCGVGTETPEAADPAVASTEAELQASCPSGYHPTAWCSGNVARAGCLRDTDGRLFYTRAVNCSDTDRYCRDYGIYANCIK